MIHYRFTDALFITFMTLFPLTCLAADLLAPSVKLPTIDKENIGENTLLISAHIQDNDAVSSVKLYYRTLDSDSSYTPVSMFPSKQDKHFYSARLNQGFANVSGIEYYVEAQDNAHNISQQPFPSQPLKLEFSKVKSLRLLKKRKEGAHFGFVINQGIVTVDDPDGATSSIADASLSTFLQFPFVKSTQMRLEAGQRNFVLPYQEIRIGQEVNSFNFDISLNQPGHVLNKSYWIGAGVSLISTKIQDRAKQSNNIITSAYPNRRQTDVALILASQIELMDFASNQLGARAKIQKSFNNGVNALDLSLYFAF